MRATGTEAADEDTNSLRYKGTEEMLARGLSWTQGSRDGVKTQFPFAMAWNGMLTTQPATVTSMKPLSSTG